MATSSPSGSIIKLFTLLFLLLTSLPFALGAAVATEDSRGDAATPRSDINQRAPAPGVLSSSPQTRDLQARAANKVYGSLIDDALVEKRSAGLRWGPIRIGNLQLRLTNPHEGYAGPKFPWANHVNFHVDKEIPNRKGKYEEVVNMHIVKYIRGKSSFCLYIWESQTKKVVFDKCFDNFVPAIKEGVEAVKNFVDEMLKAANFIAAVAIIAALVVVLVACLTALGAVAIA